MTISKLSLDQLRMCSETDSNIVEYFLLQIYFYLNNDSTIAPSRKIIHQKAALVNFNSYLSTVDLTNRKLYEEHERFLIESLKGLTNEKRLKEVHCDLISCYLITFSLSGSEKVGYFYRQNFK